MASPSSWHPEPSEHRPQQRRAASSCRQGGQAREQEERGLLLETKGKRVTLRWAKGQGKDTGHVQERRLARDSPVL